MHKPKISVKKKEEMDKLIQNIEESGYSRRLVLTKYHSQKDLIQSRTKSIDTSLVGRRSQDNIYSNRALANGSSSVLKNRIKWFNPMVPRPKLKRKGVIVDYLLNKRIKRQEKEMQNPDYSFSNKTNWDAIGVSKSQRAQSNSFSYDYSDNTIKPQSRFDKEMSKPDDLFLKQKLEIIRTQAKKIEDDAKEKERNMKISKSISVKDTNDINNMLIESINAKLHILKDI